MGASFRFVHCADLHLGCEFKGLSSSYPELENRMSEAAFVSFSRIIDLAISEKADLLVISGDIFHDADHTPGTRYRFAKELERAKIPCFICLGNHDYKRKWEGSIPYPDNVHIFPSEPERIIHSIRGDDIEILGRSFSDRLTRENLAASLKGSPGIFSIAVVHCTMDSTAKDPERAPCSISDIIGNDVDYWALGHIHKRQIVNMHPYIIYPGNIQGMKPDESGEKGAYIVTVTDDRVSDLRFIATQDVMWNRIEIDISGKDLNALSKEIGSRRDSITEITLTGRGDLDLPLRLHTEETRKMLETSAGGPLTLDIQTGPEIDMDSLRNGSDLLSKIVSSADSLSSADKETIIDSICSTKASARIREHFESMSTEELRRMIEDAKLLVIDKLREAEQ